MAPFWHPKSFKTFASSCHRRSLWQAPSPPTGPRQDLFLFFHRFGEAGTFLGLLGGHCAWALFFLRGEQLGLAVFACFCVLAKKNSVRSTFPFKLFQSSFQTLKVRFCSKNFPELLSTSQRCRHVFLATRLLANGARRCKEPNLR